MTPSLFVFCALLSEAKALIQQWSLKKNPDKHPFTLFADEERVVVITGMGGVTMAAAVAYVLALFPCRQQPLLLNLGIAGHRLHSLGSLFLADKIINTDSGKKFYPQLPFAFNCGTITVASVAKSQIGYPEDYLYDMEAAAFYEIAAKFSSSELVHSLKIVSDNSQSPIENISESAVEQWVTAALVSINALIAGLHSVRQSLPQLDYRLDEQLLAQFHFTAANAAKLKSLLLNWRLLNAGRELNWQEAEAKNAKELLVWLQRQMDGQAFYL